MTELFNLMLHVVAGGVLGVALMVLILRAMRWNIDHMERRMGISRTCPHCDVTAQQRFRRVDENANAVYRCVVCSREFAVP